MVVCRLATLFLYALFLVAATPVLAQKGKTLSTLEIEQRLLDLGFDPGPIDGTFDAKTIPALKEFQKKAGVTQTGKVDDATIAELVASGEAKMLHTLPSALLPLSTAPEYFGTKVILRHANERPGAMVVVIPRKGGYQHKLQFLGLTQDGRAHVESTVWSHGAIHEIEGPLTLAGHQITPSGEMPMVFRVNHKRGYVFVSGNGEVKLPKGKTMPFGPQQNGVVIGGEPSPPPPRAK